MPHRCDRGAPNLVALFHHRVRRDRTLSSALRLEVAPSLGEVHPPFLERQRGQNPGMPGQPFRLIREAVTELRQGSVPGRKRAAKQGEQTYPRTVTKKLSRQFESDPSTQTIAGNDTWTVGLKLANLPGEIRGQFFDACERLAVTVETGRLQAEERLIVPQVPRQGAITEYVAIVPGDAEHGRALAARLHRYEGPRLARQCPGRAKEFENVVLAVVQFIAQLGGERAGWSTASQSISICRDMHV